MKNKLLVLLIIMAIAMQVICAGVFAADYIYTYSTATNLSKGVTKTAYRLLMPDNTWVNAQVVAADLSEPHLALQILSDKRGVNYLSTVKNLAASHDTLVAINSDFFAWDSRAGRGSPIGVSYQGSAMYSSPSARDDMFSLIQSNSGDVFIDMLRYSMTLVAPNGETHPIRGLNKSDDLSGIMMYNKYWDSSSVGSTSTQYEVVVKNGMVHEIRFEQPPITLDDDTFVLATLSDWNTFLIDNFKVGDPVKIDVSSSIDFKNVNTAAGGGAAILQNGVVPKTFSHVISGNNPRTAVGVDLSGKVIYLVTVDGRLADSRGMTMTELGNFMKFIGCHNAINMDGGGSTTMVAKNPGTGTQDVVNTPSDGSQRAIATALAIKSNAPADNNIAHLAVMPDGENVWINSHINMSVISTNQYFKSLPVDISDVTWHVSGVNGYVENNKFYAKSSGIATVTATYNHISHSVKIRVLDKPFSIEPYTKEISLNVGESENVWIFARDENGYLANIPISDMIISSTKNLFDVSGTSITATQTGSAVVDLALGDARANIAVSVGGASIPAVSDSSNAMDSADKTGTPLTNSSSVFRLGVFGQLGEPNTLFNRLVMKEAATKLNSQADKAAFLSVSIPEYVKSSMSIETLPCIPFGSSVENGTTVIRLDGEGDFMSAREWTWFVNELKSLNTKNLVVLLNTSPRFKSSSETKLFRDVLTKTAADGHKIFVFSGGSQNTMSPIDGVRYISTVGFSSDITVGNFVSSLQKLQYLLIDIDNSGEISYRFMPLYGNLT